MKLKKASLSCFLILVVASVTVASGSAETDEELQSRITSTEKKIESLNIEVEQLREELNEIKEMLETSPADVYSEGSRLEYSEPTIEDSRERAPAREPTPSKQLKWEKRENWRKLRHGMSKDEVRRILGEPERISGNAFGGESWDYPGLLAGVYINSDGKLTSWDEHDFSDF